MSVDFSTIAGHSADALARIDALKAEQRLWILSFPFKEVPPHFLTMNSFLADLMIKIRSYSEFALRRSEIPIAHSLTVLGAKQSEIAWRLVSALKQINEEDDPTTIRRLINEKCSGHHRMSILFVLLRARSRQEESPTARYSICQQTSRWQSRMRSMLLDVNLHREKRRYSYRIANLLGCELIDDPEAHIARLAFDQILASE
jgi:hypothetical protein